MKLSIVLQLTDSQFNVLKECISKSLLTNTISGQLHLLEPISLDDNCGHPLTVRAANCLSAMGINKYLDLVRLSRKDLEGNKNLGQKSIINIERHLWSKGLRLNMVDNYGNIIDEQCEHVSA